MSESNSEPNVQPYDPPNREVSSIEKVGGHNASLTHYWTNLATASRSQRALITRCLNNPTLKQDDVLNRRFLLAGVLAHRVQFVDEETGEITEGVRCVLADPDGRTVAFVSNGIYKGLSLVMMLEGKGPWDSPLPIMIRQVACGGKRRTYTVELLEDESPAPRREEKRHAPRK